MSVKLVTNRGEQYFAQLIKEAIAGTAAGVTLEMHLIKADFTPSNTTTIGTIDNDEADFTGYAQWDMPTPSNATITSNKGQLDFGSNTWEKDGATGNSIYGFWIQDSTDSGSDIPIVVVKFTSSYDMSVDNTTLPIYYKQAFATI